MRSHYKNILQISLPFAFLLTNINAHAVDFVIHGSLQDGGDNLVKVHDLKNSNNSSLSAGSGLGISLGANFAINKNSYLKAMIGTVNNTLPDINIHSTNTNKYTYEWNHNLVDALYYRQLGNWKFGGGLTYHFNSESTVSGNSVNSTVEYKDAVGLKIGFNYRYSTNFFLGAEVTGIEYKVKSGTTLKNSISGNSLAIVFGYAFAD